MPEDFHHPALRLMAFIPVRSQLHYNFMSRNRPLGTFLRHKHIGADLIVIRNDKTKVLGLFVGAHKLLRAPLQNAHDLRLTPLAAPSGQERDLHPVHVKSAVRLVLGNIKIFLIPLDLHKAEAFCVADKGSHGTVFVRLHISALSRELYFSL